jgi:hypothetical protein
MQIQENEKYNICSAQQIPVIASAKHRKGACGEGYNLIEKWTVVIDCGTDVVHVAAWKTLCSPSSRLYNKASQHATLLISHAKRKASTHVK